MRLTMLCLSGFELYSRWVSLTIPTATQPILIAEKNSECKCIGSALIIAT